MLHNLLTRPHIARAGLDVIFWHSALGVEWLSGTKKTSTYSTSRLSRGLRISKLEMWRKPIAVNAPDPARSKPGHTLETIIVQAYACYCKSDCHEESRVLRMTAQWRSKPRSRKRCTV